MTSIPGDNREILSALDKLIAIKSDVSADSRLKRLQEPVSPEVFLTSRYYSGFGPGELYSYWVEQICDFINGGYTEFVITGSIGCFVGSTKIPLLDGTEATAAELAEKHPHGGEPFYVYSCDKNGDITVGKALGCWKTSDRRKVYKITLDNGAEEYFTDNHLFMMRDDSWKPVRDLAPGDSLMPLYRKYRPHEKSDYNKPGYERVYNPATEEWVPTHRVVAKWKYGVPIWGGGRAPGGKVMVVHHKKGVRNNHPDQLELMDRHDHIRLHGKMVEQYRSSEDYKQKHREGVQRAWDEGKMTGVTHPNARRAHKKFMNSEEGRRLSANNIEKHNARVRENPDEFSEFFFENGSRAVHERWNGQGHDQQRAEAAQRIKERNTRLGQHRAANRESVRKANIRQVEEGRTLDDVIMALSDCSSVNAAAKRLGVGTNYIYRIFRRQGLPDNAGSIRDAGYLNHKVVSVEYSHEEAVYDIEVEEHHNFALSSGVFVHNSGKTTAANLLLLYKFYQLLCWEDPNAYLGMPTMQEIYNIYFSVTGKQAERTGYRQFRSMVDNSQWFKDNEPRRSNIDSICEWRGGKFQLFAGSNPQHAIGMTVWSTVLDEADFYKKNGHAFDETYEAVTDLYEELSDRRTSRFQQRGRDLSFSVLISSATFQSSFVARRIQEAAHNPRIKVCNAVSYKIKPSGTYSKKRFFVFKGHKLADPEILRDKNHLNEILRKLRIKYQTTHALGRAYNYLPPRIKELIEPVPEDFRPSYERNIHKSLMNHSGVATARVGRLFQSRALLAGAYDDTLVHPFIRAEIELSTADDIQLKDYFLPGNLIDIEKPHAIHIDQSVSGDATGISMVRYDGSETDKQGIHVRRFSQVFSIRIVPPPPPATIKISKSREFVLFLRDYGVNIVRVTMDQFQSRDSMQVLTEKGIKCEYQSLDRKDDAYLAWLNLLQDRAIRMYYYKPLEVEALDAVHDRRRRKVDHPKTGTIDVLQSFVGALYSLVCMSDMHTEVDTSFMDRIEQQTHDPFGLPVVDFHDTLDSAYLATRHAARNNMLLKGIL